MTVIKGRRTISEIASQKAEMALARANVDTENRVSNLERRPSSGCGAWVTPTLINSWANAGSPYCTVEYRKCGSTLEFKGHISGGASGSIAFYLDAAYWPTCDLSTVTDVVRPTTPGIAQIYVAASNGAVTITNIV